MSIQFGSDIAEWGKPLRKQSQTHRHSTQATRHGYQSTTTEFNKFWQLSINFVPIGNKFTEFLKAFYLIQ